MATTCFISYSHDNINKEKVTKISNIVNGSSKLINFSEREDKSMYSEETIWKYLHDRIAGSTCTILFLTEDLLTYNNYKLGYVRNNFIESGWVYNEISASLRDWKDNRINGIVCVVEDHLASYIADSSGKIDENKLHEILAVNSEYIVWVMYSEFLKNPHEFIDIAKAKRDEQIKSGEFRL